ncbi:unnamed protein product [Adineta steineri]|uniref:NAD(P)(+)--arginine ADP-ribosyltransferase n=1 Tax=Adineta steineri TaxID=433720 RepID=A0A819MFF0_9BILA|nr:unnamed protein product [Adineta steineri]
MSLEEINQVEQNGSTALHVAAFRGHEKIVELLLEKGAYYTILNKYKNTAYNEAANGRIKRLIQYYRYAARFIGDATEWIITTNVSKFQVKTSMQKLEAYGRDPNFDQLITYIIEHYLEKDLQDINNIINIKQYFEQAIHEKDPVHLLKAYTANSDFYLKLNFHLAQLNYESLTDQKNLSYAYYIGLVSFHPKLETLSYIGTSYRGMIINNDNLQQYKIGKQILIKTLLSTSKHIRIASQFCKTNQKSNDQLNVICIYEICNCKSALNIEDISEFPDDQEVLILPYTRFEIIDIQYTRSDTSRIEIKLKQCE